MTKRESYQLRHIVVTAESMLRQIRKRKARAGYETVRMLEEIQQEAMLRLIQEEGYRAEKDNACLTIGKYDYFVPINVVRRKVPKARRNDAVKPLDVYVHCPKEINGDFASIQQTFYQTGRVEDVVRFLKARLYPYSDGKTEKKDLSPALVKPRPESSSYAKAPEAEGAADKNISDIPKAEDPEGNERKVPTITIQDEHNTNIANYGTDVSGNQEKPDESTENVMILSPDDITDTSLPKEEKNDEPQEEEVVILDEEGEPAEEWTGSEGPEESQEENNIPIITLPSDIQSEENDTDTSEEKGAPIIDASGISGEDPETEEEDAEVAEEETEEIEETEDQNDASSAFDAYHQLQNALAILEKAKDAEKDQITLTRRALRTQKETIQKITKEKETETEARKKAEEKAETALKKEAELEEKINAQAAALSKVEEETKTLRKRAELAEEEALTLRYRAEKAEKEAQKAKNDLAELTEEMGRIRAAMRKEREEEEERRKPVYGTFPESRNILSISRSDVTMDYFRIRVLSSDDVVADELEIIAAPLSMRVEHPPIAVWAGRNLIPYTFVSGQDGAVRARISNFEYVITGTMNGPLFSADVQVTAEGYHLSVLSHKSFGDRGHILLNDGDIYVHVIPVTFSNDEGGGANYMYVILNKDKCYVGDNHTGEEVHVGTSDDKVIRCSWTDNRLSAALSYTDN